MKEAEIKLQARLIAIEHLLTNLYKVAFEAIGLSQEEIDEIVERQIEYFDKETFPGAPAASGDLWAAEIRDAVSNILSSLSSRSKED
jgi:hypothetical protein